MPTSEQEAHALIQAIDELLDATGLGRVELIIRKVGPSRYLARFALELPNRGGSITYTPPEETAGPLVEACQAAGRKFQEEGQAACAGRRRPGCHRLSAPPHPQPRRR